MDDIVLIGITTEQPTANLVPIIHSKANAYVAVESKKATEQNWGGGLESVLKQRGIRYEKILIEQDSLQYIIDRVKDWLIDKKIWDKRIGWILGGGLKIQQFAFFHLFTSRVHDKKEDFALYADPSNGEIHLLVGKDGNINVKKPSKLKIQLSLHEIIKSFNFEVQRYNNQYSNLDPREIMNEYSKFKTDQAYRYKWFTLYNMIEKAIQTEVEGNLDGSFLDFIMGKIDIPSNIREVLCTKVKSWASEHSFPAERKTVLDNEFCKQMINKICNDLTDPNTWYSIEKPHTHIQTPIGSFSKFSSYFEKLICLKVLAWKQERRPPLVGDIQVNVEIMKNGKTLQEHDILMSLTKGTLLSLDVKTWQITSKDFLARLWNLQSTSGRYAELYLVFPWFIEDQDFIPEELKILPQTAKEKRQNFVIVSSTDDSFYIRYNKHEKKFLRSDKTKDAIECITLEHLLSGLENTSI